VPHTWSPETPLNSPRQGLAAATADSPSTGSGFGSWIYAVGGNDGTGPVSTVEAYDPFQKTWTGVNPLPTARENPAATGGRGPTPKPAFRTCVYAVGGDDGSTALATVEVYDPSTRSRTSGPSLPTARSGPAAVTGPDGLIYVIGGYDGGYLGTVEAYDPTANTWAGRASMPTPRSRLATARGLDGLIYAIGGQNAGIGSGTLATLEVFDPTANAWTIAPSMPAGRWGLAAAAGPDGLIYAMGGNNAGGLPENTMYGYDPARQIWVVQTPLPTPRAFLAADTGPDGLVYAIGGSNFSNPVLATVEGFTTLSVSTFPLPPPGGGVPEGIVAGRDGHLWFTEFFGAKIGRLDPTTGKINEFPTPTANSFPRGITVGPGSDHHLWFTEETYRIGRLDPSTGLIHEFPVPTTGGVPAGITAGHDGNLWFTTAGGYIGRLHPSTGTVTLFTLLPINPLSSPRAITIAPNGILWFVDGSNIGRLSPSSPHSPTEFPVPGAGSSMQGIVVGPDGNIWFTEPGSFLPPFFEPGKIARMTPAGLLTGEFPTPTGRGEPLGITVGPDNNLWFTEFRAAKVGRITPAGVFTAELPVGLGTDPGGIATGPDGNVWFTSFSGIEKITL
jgi:streptogramin lyase